MPSVSTAQQSLMAQAYGIKTGDLKPSDLNPKYRKQIVALADGMTAKELKKFAKTKHKGLPQHVGEGEIKETEMGVVPSDTIPTYSPKGPGTIVPFLNPDSQQKKKGKKNLQNLKDYRDWIGHK
jgi:hypothetical protein